jgi:hypothetical protein
VSTCPFLLAHGDEVGGQRTQLLLGLPHALLGEPPLGDLVGQFGALLVEIHEHRHLRLEHFRHQRFDQIVDGPDFVATENRSHLVGCGGQENDRRDPRTRALADQLRGLEAVHARHPHVEQDNREIVVERAAQGFLAGICQQEVLVQAP